MSLYAVVVRRNCDAYEFLKNYLPAEIKVIASDDNDMMIIIMHELYLHIYINYSELFPIYCGTISYHDNDNLIFLWKNL